MELTVKGKGKLKERELWDAIEIMMRIMKAHRLLKNLDITVRFRKMRTQAQVEEIDAREFVIDISTSLTKHNTLMALAHELVHIKQFCRKELMMVGPNIVYRGETLDPKRVDYYDMPHEIEAYGRELGLVERYEIERRKRHKKKTQQNQGLTKSKRSS